MNGLSTKTKRSLIIVALILIAAAVVWIIVLENGSYTRDLCKKINSYGYNVSPSDLYSKAYGSNTSISKVLDEDLSVVSEQSMQCGFPADINRVGTVEMMLWRMNDGKVMVIYLLDHMPELVFIEDPETGETRPIG